MNKNIDQMFANINLDKKKILDIGSGVGGVDIYLTQKYNVDITGVDVESFVVEESKRRLEKTKKSLKGKVTFLLEAPTDYLKQSEKDLHVVHAMHFKSSHGQFVHFFIEVHNWDGEPKVMEPNKCMGTT